MWMENMENGVKYLRRRKFLDSEEINLKFF